MSDASRAVQDVLMERLAVIQKISEATAEQVRLVQKHSGMQVLDMADADDTQVASDLDTSEEALVACGDKIASLETRLAHLDQELAAMTDGEPT